MHVKLARFTQEVPASYFPIKILIEETMELLVVKDPNDLIPYRNPLNGCEDKFKIEEYTSEELHNEL